LHARAVPAPTDALRKVPLFSLLDDHEIEALASRVDELEASAGTELFHAGDPGDAMYVVLDGKVEVYCKNATGERMVMEEPGPGEYFGEISLFDGGARTASATVTKTLHALIIDRGDLESFLEDCPTAAIDLLAASGRRLRESSRLLRESTSRDINVATQDVRSTVERAADWISDFSGSLPFLFMHLVVFALWIVLNVPPLAKSELGGWDLYPFGLLTMSVSLEAIILSVFVLLSQNRQIARDRVRNDIEYEVNLKAELEVAELHQKVDRLYEQLTRRLHNIERSGGNHGGGTSLPPR